MKVDSTARDWDRFVTQMHDIHLRNTVAWANDATGMDLADQIDPAFRPVPGLVPGWSRAGPGGPHRARPHHARPHGIRTRRTQSHRTQPRGIRPYRRPDSLTGSFRGADEDEHE
ncbi:hypothetical protein [Frankia sp. CiP1_Cm_nod2]|uniref:hypothetical protein n=1 Tax=Frankia sp. CiP1_Cm_nod2 TaxID=2897161 RepID=UPI002024AE08